MPPLPEENLGYEELPQEDQNDDPNNLPPDPAVNEPPIIFHVKDDKAFRLVLGLIVAFWIGFTFYLIYCVISGY